MRKGLLILTSVIGLAASLKHEFYVSITEVYQKHDTLQVSMRLFTDDLEKAVNAERDEKVFLDQSSDYKTAKLVIREYLEPHFIVSIAAKEVKEEWLGHEYVDDVTWVYAQVIIPENTQILFIRNTVLIDQYADQQNIIHFQSGEQFEKLLANKSRPEVRVLIEE